MKPGTAMPSGGKKDIEKLILNTISLVRSRKARPDLERISKVMQRNHGVDPKDTEEWLEILVEKGTVDRRPFKGAVSYRVVGPDERIGARNGVRSLKILKRIIKAMASLIPSGGNQGVTFAAIERYVANRWTAASPMNLRVRLRAGIREGLEEGKIVKVSPGHYKLGQIPQTYDEINEDDSTGDTDEILCDYCQLSADTNPLGQPEELLVCKDCGNKAHPSCLNYSPELVERIRGDDYWQCIDCKACTVCDGTGDPDTLLFCDACDKGYHMQCHVPRLTQMPIGKWVCDSCVQKGYTNSTQVFIIDDDEESLVSPEVKSNRVNVTLPTGAQATMIPLSGAQTVSPSVPTTPSTLVVSTAPSRTPSSHTNSSQTMVSTPKPTQNEAHSNNNSRSFSHPKPVRRHSRMEYSSLTSSNSTPRQQSHKSHTQYGIYPVVGSRNSSSSRTISPDSSGTVVHKMSSRGQNSVLFSPLPYPSEVKTGIREDVLRSLPQDVADWSVDDVLFYLKAHGYAHEGKLFEEQEIDGKALLLMSRNDVLTGLRLKLGPALKIYHMHIIKLQSRTDFIG